MFVCVESGAQTDSISASYNVEEVEVKGLHYNNQYKSLTPIFSLLSSDFQRLNISDMTSALRRLPSLTLRDYGGAGGMKTVSVRGLGSQHTGVLLDGLMLTDVQSGQIDLQNFLISEISSINLSIAGSNNIFLPARNMSRASVLYIETSDSVSSNVSLSLGSWGLITPTLRFGKKIGNVILSVQGGYMYAKNNYPFTVHNGIATHRERRVNSRMNQGFINFSSFWSISAGTTLKTLVRMNDNDRQLPGIVRLYINENDESLRDRGIIVQSLLTTRLNDNIWLKTALRWNWAQQQYHNGMPSGGIRSENYIQREYYTTSSLLYQPFHNLELDYSIDFWHNSMTTTLAANPNPKRNSLLQSVSAKWNSGRLTVSGSVLNSNIDSEHKNSPSVSASLRFNNNLYIRIAAKEIFRMPTMTEMYYFRIGTQELKPENTKQLNMGITFHTSVFQGRMNFGCSADAYINNVDNKIIALPFNMFVWRYVNMPGVNGKGIDVVCNSQFEYSKSNSLSLAVNYSLQSISNKSVVEQFRGLQIAYTPVHSGSATMSWLNPWINISATVTTASETLTTNEHSPNTRIEGYSELAVSLYKTMRIKSMLIDAAFVVQNLLDSEYYIMANYPMPGRNWKLSLTYKF